MSCYKPLNAYRSPLGGPLTIKKYDFELEEKNYKKLKVPCRNCLGCRLDYQQEWALRGHHEAHGYENNYFVTLTYDDDHLPQFGHLKKPDYQNFLKALRRDMSNKKLRYVVAGEYGETTQRPHYHMSLYNSEELEMHWLNIVDTNQYGNEVYLSPELNEIWKKGNVYITPFSRRTAGYVAGYQLKDMKARSWEKKNGHLDESTGELVPKQAPFMHVSRGPAIGVPFVEAYPTDIFPEGKCLLKGRHYPAPEAYLRWKEKDDPEVVANIREERSEYTESETFKLDNTPERLLVKRAVRKGKLNLAKEGGRLVI